MEIAALYSPADDAGYQKSRDDKKNVHANITASESGHFQMEKQNSDNREGAQSVDIGKIAGGFARPWHAIDAQL